MSEYQRDERLQRLFEVGQEIYASDIAEAIPAIESLERRLQEAEKEGLEQARLLGMSGEREADLRGKLQRAEQKIIQLESEAAVKDYALNDVLYRIETENLHWGEIDTIKDALSGGTAGRELLERLQRAEKEGLEQAKMLKRLRALPDYGEYEESRRKCAFITHEEYAVFLWRANNNILTNFESRLAVSEKARDGMRKGIIAVEELMRNSMGVVGLHKSGEIAEWAELATGGRYEDWLAPLDEAIKIMDAALSEPLHTEQEQKGAK